jgi:hypothetical protein
LIKKKRELNKHNHNALSNRVSVGMSSTDVYRSWGNPTKINRSSHGSDQWVYHRKDGTTDYVYVNDGKVSAWQGR